MGQKSCSGTESDLANPACATEITRKMYRDNDQRWYCVGLVAGEAWTCGSSLSETQANRLPKNSTPNTAQTFFKPFEAFLSEVSKEAEKLSDFPVDLSGSVMPPAAAEPIAAISPPVTTAKASTVSVIATRVAALSSANESFTSSALQKVGTRAIPESLPLAGNSTEQPRAAATSLGTPPIGENLNEALTANSENKSAIGSIQPFGITKAFGSNSKTPASSMAVSTINTDVIVPGNQPFPANTSLAQVFIADAKRHETSHSPLASLLVGVTAPARSESDLIPAQKNLPTQLANVGSSSLLVTEETPKPQAQVAADLSQLDQLAQENSLIESQALEDPATFDDATYDYFMDLPLDYFAVQLKAGNTLRGILNFASSVDLADPIVLKVQPLKKPLFVLVLDTFDDIQVASDAKHAWLSQFDNGIEPWILTVGSLQKSMQPIGPLD